VYGRNVELHPADTVVGKIKEPGPDLLVIQEIKSLSGIHACNLYSRVPGKPVIIPGPATAQDLIYHPASGTAENLFIIMDTCALAFFTAMKTFCLFPVFYHCTKI
jgi:hypothetical protein